MNNTIGSILLATGLMTNAFADSLSLITINGNRMVNDSALNMTWADNNWQGWAGSPAELVASLNAQNYGGYNDWQVPTGDGLLATQYILEGSEVVAGYGASTDGVLNQLGYLMNELGNTYSSFNVNYGPFTNLATGTIGTSSGNWRYNLFAGFNYLYNDPNYTINSAYFGTIAVRNGIAVIPEPSTYAAIFGFLVLVGTAKYRYMTRPRNK